MARNGAEDGAEAEGRSVKARVRDGGREAAPRAQVGRRKLDIVWRTLCISHFYIHVIG